MGESILIVDDEKEITDLVEAYLKNGGVCRVWRERRFGCMMKTIKFLHYFIGVGALLGGITAILNPEGPLGLSTEVLINGPFKSFLIPGLFLFLFLGVGNILAGYFIKKKWGIQGYISGIFATGLVFWILIQCYILNDINILHIIYFLLGATQGILAIALLIRDKPFPFQMLKKDI